MNKITNIIWREVLDSRWNPTVEVEVFLESGYWKAIAPSWASTWVHEALELRDWDKNRFLWKWVEKAVKNVNISIKNAVLWKEFKDFRDFDKFLIDLDWTKNKSKLWANAILPVSMAFVWALANSANKEIYEFLWEWKWVKMPVPLMNIINWWEHANNALDFQEFMIVPVWFDTIKERVRVWAEIFHTLKWILKEKWMNTAVWDEWWFAPDFKSNKEWIETVIKAIEKAWYSTEQVKISLDVAASEFYENWKYILKSEWRELNSSQMIDYFEEMVANYPIFSIEDWLDEDDFEWWKEMQKRLWDKMYSVWDDLFVTNIERIQMWIDQNLANSILIKLNQIWTVSETLDAINLWKENDMISIVSHRSGETEDTFIADLAVATNVWYIKAGSLSRSDRVAKYNRLIRIEEKLNN